MEKDHQRPRRVMRTRVVTTIPMPSLGPLDGARRSMAQYAGLVATAVALVFCIVTLPGDNIDTSLPPARPSSVGQRSLYSSSAGTKMSFRGIRRDLQEEEDTASTLDYETVLQLYMCIPSLDVDEDNSDVVGEDTIAAALASIGELGQSNSDEIGLTIKTAPLHTGDDKYLCDTVGTLQWHAQIKYGSELADASGSTPAVMAARANDYVAYSSNAFKTFLISSIENYDTSAESVGLSVADIIIANVGWTVSFPSEATTAQETETSNNSDGVMVGLTDGAGLWTWWVWLIYGALVACCLLPLCCVICRRRRKDDARSSAPLAETPEGRSSSSDRGPDRVRDPEWGAHERSFDGKYQANEAQEMKRDDLGDRRFDLEAFQTSKRPGFVGFGGGARIQQVSKTRAWAPPGNSARRGGRTEACRLDGTFTEHGEGGARGEHRAYGFGTCTGSRPDEFLITGGETKAWT